MKKVIKLAPFAILCLVILCSVVVIAVLAGLSPSQVHAEISEVRIGNQEPYIHMLGNRLNCTEDNVESLVQCVTSIASEELVLIVEYENSSRTHLLGCQALYSEKDVDCTASFSLRYRAPYVIIREDLGLNNQQLELLRKQNPWSYLAGIDWQNWITVLSLILTINTIIILWQLSSYLLMSNSRKQTKASDIRTAYRLSGYFAGGIMAFFVSRYAFTIILLLLGLVD